MRKILIAGMGNVLRRDDGFGVEVARQLAARRDQPGSLLQRAEVKVIEVGIGGIHLVQELMDRYDVLVVVDALERGGAPGKTYVLEAEVPDLESWSEAARQDFLADMHYTTPSKALILAKALKVLPPIVFIVGCQPSDAEGLGLGLSEAIQQATSETIHAIEHIISRSLQ